MVQKVDDRPFHLKQFSLHHHRSSMKVGTDSLLLGIWVQPEEAQRILDIGTGCGILALLMAARSKANLDAIEYDKASYEEAKQNFHNSPYHDRLFAIHDDFTNFAQQGNNTYDLIISNPPFFVNDMRPKENIRSNARHGDKLNYNDLCSGVHRLMNTNGRFCLVLPYEESKIFRSVAEKYGLYVRRQLLIFPKRGWQPNRVNLELTREKYPVPLSEKFIIREEDNSFTQQYIDFFKNFLIGPDK